MEALPSLRQLKYLTALAESQSFSKAADICNVTQSTLSAGIAALENLLGQALVDRSRRQVSLTPLGREIADKAHKLVLEAADIVIRAQQANAPLSGTLRLGIIPTVAPYLVQVMPGWLALASAFLLATAVAATVIRAFPALALRRF